jgi:ubiquitin-like protein Pup
VPTRDTGGQHHGSRQDQEAEVDEARETAAAEAAAASDLQERREQLDEDVDAILDEIDDVLETNAAEFVQSFVQKGGQ